MPLYLLAISAKRRLVAYSYEGHDGPWACSQLSGSAVGVASQEARVLPLTIHRRRQRVMPLPPTLVLEHVWVCIHLIFNF